MPEDMPDGMSDRMPEDMPEDMPDRMSDRMPEDMPDRMPEGMPDRMPDKMSDRMPVPECLLDRMPEDLHPPLYYQFFFLGVQYAFLKTLFSKNLADSGWGSRGMIWGQE